ncbi:hypothetical protein ONS95_002722 [Cadophora gregata]|uniref:uncharacterized protein n=1 Tax=Cadophora gregata TaxID=51156 RepID=UPI0026DD404F|nr:uncharacterized protein ONS95_002722 [Cadophora gregata]KAK0110065.1 hypothetical protein ONS95_002722 [Cadophora gregata]KAK0110316.1 hypothetical protein ONS96_001933 [Cadophora gregata f. sp. sojae]
MHILNSIAIISISCIILQAYTSEPLRSLADVFDGELANLSLPTPWGNPFLGAQDFYHCCLVAVNQSLTIDSGNLTFLPGQTALRGSIDDFQSNPFPCGGTYDGSNGYPAQVWVSYTWCSQTCPGWAMSWTGYYSLKLWLKPLVAFITPSAIFCLNVPRRRKINVSRHLFPRKIGSPLGILSLAYKLPLAALIVTLDLVLWTITCLTLSGPMLLSATYEALLDARLLRYLKVRIGTNALSVKQRAHLLVAILFGSLDQDPAWNDCKRILQDLPDDNLRRRFSSITTNGPLAMPQPATTVITGSTEPKRPSFSSVASPRRQRIAAEYAISTGLQIDLVKLKLRSAMESQMSFGSTTGAAIVFYVGNFAYTLIELRAAYGETDLSHQLAFGMIWMIIPHIAILSSLLLACNNPSICEGLAHPISMGRDRLLSVEEAAGIEPAKVSNGSPGDRSQKSYS